ncbi:MAG: hypothetical protein RBU23_08905 [Candidatus Auribacterota bacterium]|jgi:hypothetical protein|nr:hypothetical protein [Candidatus Auribacterota bacterium]
MENKMSVNNTVLEENETTVYNKPADKLMVLISAFVSGGALFLVSSFVLRYQWYTSVLYFIAMAVWVVLFFEYFNYSLFRKPPETNE